MTKVYLAGPMSGYPAFNIPAFDDAARTLRAIGYEVISPAEIDGPVSREVLLASERGSHTDLPKQESYGFYLGRDMQIIVDEAPELIVTLPGWKGSRGAGLEVALCDQLHIPQVEYETLMAGVGWAHVQMHVNDEPHEHDGVQVDPQCPVCADPVVIEWINAYPIDGSNTPLGELVAQWHSEGHPMSLDEYKQEVSLMVDALHMGAQPVYDENFVPYSENPERQRAVTGAVKDNRSKSRMDLIPGVALVEVGKVLAHGAQKYKPNNWRLGLSWSQTMGSILRHLAAFSEGEDLDPESGLPHVAHAACQILFLLTYVTTETGIDDRFTSTDPTEARA
jgi:hypothetical protein